RSSNGSGAPLRARLRFGVVYWAMIPLRGALMALLMPVQLTGQATVPPPYRGFTPGIPYRAFVQQARALADNDVLRCQTSPRTAQIMECAVLIRDPRDGARFYLSAHFIESDADMVALYDSAGFGDAEDERLLERGFVYRAPERDLDAVHGVAELVWHRHGEGALLLPGHAADGLDQHARRRALQPVQHLLDEMWVAVEQLARREIH